MRLAFIALLCILSGAANAQWTYRTVDDKMRSSKKNFAELNSANQAQLSFPYKGGSTLQLIVFKNSKDDELDVLFWLKRGQMPCHDHCMVSAKFDNDEISEWRSSGPAAGRSDAVYIKNSAEFLERLRLSKKLTVEVQIYDGGNFQYQFKTAGLTNK